MLNDPRILATKLDDLSDNLFAWSTAVGETLRDAQTVQQHTTEKVTRVRYRGQILQKELEDDQEVVQRIDHDLSTLLITCAEAESATNQTRELVQQCTASAHDCLHRCQEQLQAAQVWLERARQRLMRAQTTYRSTQAELHVARQALQAAERALFDCRNQKSRDTSKHCLSEETSVYTARMHIATVETKMRKAENEVRMAEAEVRQAEARVIACTEAVMSAQQAIELVRTAEANAQKATSSARQSLEYEEIARQAFVEVGLAFADEEAAIKDTQAHMSLIETFANDVVVHLQNVEYFEAEVQRYASLARQELVSRVKDLLEFNRETL